MLYTYFCRCTAGVARTSAWIHALVCATPAQINTIYYFKLINRRPAIASIDLLYLFIYLFIYLFEECSARDSSILLGGDDSPHRSRHWTKNGETGRQENCPRDSNRCTDKSWKSRARIRPRASSNFHPPPPHLLENSSLFPTISLRIPEIESRGPYRYRLPPVRDNAFPHFNGNWKLVCTYVCVCMYFCYFPLILCPIPWLGIKFRKHR